MKTLIIAGIAISMMLCPGVRGEILLVPDTYSTIQSGIDAAHSGDTVLVKAGTYSGMGNRNIQIEKSDITLSSQAGPESTVIDIESFGDGIRINLNPEKTVEIDGFTIRNAAASGHGGGIDSIQGSPVIRNCIIDSCRSDQGGGGISAANGSPVLDSLVISDNMTDERGGGIELRDTTGATLTNLVISGNSAGTSGGGLSIDNCHDLYLSVCTFSGNDGNPGGGIWMRGSDDVEMTDLDITLNSHFGFIANRSTFFMVNTMIHENGGGIKGWGMNPSMMNVTIADNTELGGFDLQTGNLALANSIIWNNQPFEFTASGTSVTGPPIPTISYSDIRGGYPGEGNIDSDPLFVAGLDGAYFLSQRMAGQDINSPCLDAGSDLAQDICFDYLDDTICMSDLSTSILYQHDIEIVDLGAHYFNHFTPPTPTPVHTAIPTPTPEAGVRLSLPGSPFEAGELFNLRANCRGPGEELTAALAVVLDVYGEYWFYPSWRQDFDARTITLEPGLPIDLSILSFIWPSGEFGTAYGLYFWGALLDRDTWELIGTYDKVTFGYLGPGTGTPQLPMDE